jgi:hypothetical protein
VERLNLRKQNELEVRKQYLFKISNRFADLKNLKYSQNINRAWENVSQAKISEPQLKIVRSV